MYGQFPVPFMPCVWAVSCTIHAICTHSFQYHLYVWAVSCTIHAICMSRFLYHSCHTCMSRFLYHSCHMYEQIPVPFMPCVGAVSCTIHATCMSRFLYHSCHMLSLHFCARHVQQNNDFKITVIESWHGSQWQNRWREIWWYTMQIGDRIDIYILLEIIYDTCNNTGKPSGGSLVLIGIADYPRRDMDSYRTLTIRNNTHCSLLCLSLCLGAFLDWHLLIDLFKHPINNLTPPG